MTEILTAEQVTHMGPNPGNPWWHDWKALRDSHEALRADRNNWQATAEESTAKNLNESLADRHKMREARLKRDLALLQAKYDALEARCIPRPLSNKVIDANEAADWDKRNEDL